MENGIEFIVLSLPASVIPRMGESFDSILTQLGVVDFDLCSEGVRIGGIASVDHFEFQEMASKHGNKKYYQLLLDPNRSILIEQYAKERGIRVTAAMKEMFYKQIEALMPNKYQQAKGVDEMLWRKSVSNRIEGKRKARQHKDLTMGES